jgi:hypothetical protein
VLGLELAGVTQSAANGGFAGFDGLECGPKGVGRSLGTAADAIPQGGVDVFMPHQFLQQIFPWCCKGISHATCCG